MDHETASLSPSRDRLIITDDDPLGDRLTKPDGSRWPLVVTTAKGVILADSATAVFEEMIPGYAEIPDGPAGDDEATSLRYELCVQVADAVQQRVAAEAEELGRFDPSASDEVTLTTLFTPRAERPVEEAIVWDHPVPLICLWTDYAPHGPLVAPSGNIWWLDPSTEMALLRSMAELNVLGLMRTDS